MKNLKHEQGVAGMEILTALISGIFLIAMITFSLVLTGSKMMDATTDETARGIINDSINSFADVSDFFPIFVIIGSVVVLILLIVIIIRAVNGANMLSAGQGMGA